jgi:hypothetical protein
MIRANTWWQSKGRRRPLVGGGPFVFAAALTVV